MQLGYMMTTYYYQTNVKEKKCINSKTLKKEIFELPKNWKCAKNKPKIKKKYQFLIFCNLHDKAIHSSHSLF